MPFTLSHAAAALPFGKFKPIWPALVIGTFAPDLQYFIWISDEDRSGHHFPGVLLFSLPLALLLLWLFEWCVKGAVIELLPDAVERRLQDKVRPLSFWGWRRLAAIVMWIVIGIATHVFWDWFTHGRTWITARWAVFTEKVPVPFHSPMAVAKILQHGSTVVGLLVLAAWCVAWYRRTPPMPRADVRQLSSSRKVTVVFILVVVAVLAGYPLAIYRLADHPLPLNPLLFIVTVFEATTLIFCVQVLIYGLARSYTARSRRIPVVRLNGPSR
ncbi:MAG TPA: DUF4184 family protein [Terriglobales bacterium]|jgi:hypothetical protein